MIFPAGEFGCARIDLGIGGGDHAVLQDRLEVPGIFGRFQDQAFRLRISRNVENVGAGQSRAVVVQKPDAGARHFKRADRHPVDLAKAIRQIGARETGVARERAQR
jgi:hypothetical protein